MTIQTQSRWTCKSKVRRQPANFRIKSSTRFPTAWVLFRLRTRRLWMHSRFSTSLTSLKVRVGPGIRLKLSMQGSPCQSCPLLTSTLIGTSSRNTRSRRGKLSQITSQVFSTSLRVKLGARTKNFEACLQLRMKGKSRKLVWRTWAKLWWVASAQIWQPAPSRTSPKPASLNLKK